MSPCGLTAEWCDPGTDSDPTPRMNASSKVLVRRIARGNVQNLSARMKGVARSPTQKPQKANTAVIMSVRMGLIIGASAADPAPPATGRSLAGD